MQIFGAPQISTAIHMFSFDFGMFRAVFKPARAQAGRPPVKVVGQSAFSSKTRLNVLCATVFVPFPLMAYLGRLLQMPIWVQIFGAVDASVGRAFNAKMRAPVLFHQMALGRRDLCGINAVSLTARTKETRAKLAAFVRPQIQKVRIC